ncbi:hypothetical protein KY343_05720, partial [Candidatus Woesearchaeota archaeon]|nr:hypothetical protein [Candidatus Woesearchaeota archaeon]
EDLVEKKFEGFLILNWKTKQMRVMKKKPQGNNPFEIPVLIKINVKVPKMKTIVAKGEVELSRNQVKEMVIEEL